MTITTPAQMREALDAALADYTPGIDRAVRFVTIDQVDMLVEFYLHNRALPMAEPEPVAVNAVMCAAERDAQSRDAVDLTLFRQAIRAEALEEAAKLPPYDGDGDPAGPFDHHVFVKRDAIRALMEKPE